MKRPSEDALKPLRPCVWPWATERNPADRHPAVSVPTSRPLAICRRPLARSPPCPDSAAGLPRDQGSKRRHPPLRSARRWCNDQDPTPPYPCTKLCSPVPTPEAAPATGWRGQMPAPRMPNASSIRPCLATMSQSAAKQACNASVLGSLHLRSPTARTHSTRRWAVLGPLFRIRRARPNAPDVTCIEERGRGRASPHCAPAAYAQAASPAG